MVATYTKATQYDKLSHSALFKATPNGLYALHGKKWVCIDGCSIKFYTGRATTQQAALDAAKKTGETK